MNQKLVLDVIIEIPKNSNIKYEYNRLTKRLHVDRILYGSNVYPQNYGFIENTIDWDGDELDALVIANQGFQVGAVLPARILGSMDMIDGGEIDTKLIAVIDCDPRFVNYQTLNDVPLHLLNEIKDFFLNYKNLQNKKVEVGNFHALEFAHTSVEECKTLYEKYHHLKKSEFLKLMKKNYPEKYKN